MTGSQDLEPGGTAAAPLGLELEQLRLRLAADIEALAGAHERRHLAQIQATTASPGFPRRTG